MAYCYSCILTIFSSRLFYRLEGGFSPNYLFLFNNTYWCYPYVCTVYLLITAVFVINNGLEYFTNLGIAYIRHSSFLIPHILFLYKLVLVFLKLGV